MLTRLLKALLPRQEWRQMEDHFSRQANAAEAEVTATRESLRTAARNAVIPLDPEVDLRYQHHLCTTDNPALAEIATIHDVQTVQLARAFSVLDFSHTERLNRQRGKLGLPPL